MNFRLSNHTLEADRWSSLLKHERVCYFSTNIIKFQNFLERCVSKNHPQFGKKNDSKRIYCV